MRARFVLFELLWLAACLGCGEPSKRPEPMPKPALNALLAPRAASPFRLVGDRLRQAQPRLPDTGEWRCAERDGVVWCAGGEAAAGVVAGPPDPGYRCGPRWGDAAVERICIDEHPDYPNGGYQCAFEQERGIARTCRKSVAARGPALPSRALPACWVDRDCPVGHCDRGACGCSQSPDCKSGRCEGGVCVEAKP